MNLNIVCIPGDGIGPEIVTEAKKVLEKVARVYGHEISYQDILMGGASIDVHGVPLTDEAIATAKEADGIHRWKYDNLAVVQAGTESSPRGRPFKTA